MKTLWVLPCLILCACVNNGSHAQDTMYDTNNEPNYNVVVQEPVAPANPYALQPPAYEQQSNLALSQKEQELFQKEKHLLDSQQELYEREKKLADREAAFINRSKALDYKEKSIMEGRVYAPLAVQVPSVMPAPAPVAIPAPVVAPVPAPVPQVVFEQVPPPPAPVPVVVAPKPTYPIVNAPAQTVRVYYAEPTANVAPAVEVPCEEDINVNVQETVEVSQAVANYQPTEAGFIIMQHPIQRDLVRCPATDDVCLLSYERLGYVRASNLSNFAAQDDFANANPVSTPW